MPTDAPPGFAVIYRWRLRAGTEAAFARAWEALTLALRDERGALGSRLHRASDGWVVAYAQWPDERAWREGRELPSPDPEASAAMAECLEESAPPETLAPWIDRLVSNDARSG